MIDDSFAVTSEDAMSSVLQQTMLVQFRGWVGARVRQVRLKYTSSRILHVVSPPTTLARQDGLPRPR